MIQRHLNRSQICPERQNALKDMNMGERSAFRFFSGHFNLRDLPSDLFPCRLVTILRDPAERIVSIYHFLRAHRWSYIRKHGLDDVAFAKETPLQEWLKSRGLDWQNVMTNTLANPADIAPEHWSGQNSQMLKSACRTLDRCDALGLFEMYDDSVDLIHARLGLRLPRDIPHLQVTPGVGKEGQSVKYLEKIEKQPVTPQIAALLKGMNPLDSQLHLYAKAAFLEDLASLHAERISRKGAGVLQAAKRIVNLVGRNVPEIRIASPEQVAAWRQAAKAARDAMDLDLLEPATERMPTVQQA